jgi:hypothetical protein
MDRVPDLSVCLLCDRPAVVEWREGDAHFVVSCPECLRYALDEYLMHLFTAARLGHDERILRLLPRLSVASHQAAEQGGRLNLTAETWRAAASDAGRENP